MTEIKLSNSTLQELSKSAKADNRSIAQQAEYWIGLGKAFERSELFKSTQIEKALTGKLSPDDLSPDVQDIFFEVFVQATIDNSKQLSENDWADAMAQDQSIDM